MRGWQAQDKNRLLSAILAALIHIAIGFLLISGLAMDVVRKTSSAMKVTNVIAEAPIPPSPPKPEVLKEVKPQGAASPKNIKSKAAPREAPKPIVKLPLPKPKITAEKAGKGNDATAGSSEKIGPGSGAGGQGAGTGAGGTGNGGGGIKLLSRASYISGRIKNSDYPRGASKANAEGVVIVRFTIYPDGRAGQCRVTKSSGNAELDSTTCRLIEKRFRYKPARDASGNAIEDVTGWKQDWWLENKTKKVEVSEKP